MFAAPVRLAGKTPLNPIPNEIYVEIFDYFTPTSRIVGLTEEADYKRTLSNLALVCRFFCAIALPRIFKSLRFSGTSNIDPTAEPSHASLCRGIIKGQEPATSLSRYVKECTFTSWTKDPKWVYDGFLGMYGQALGRMSNLQSLTLKRMEIDKRFLKTICGLKGVQSLEMDLCGFLDDVTTTSIQKLTSLKLKNFLYKHKPLSAEDIILAIFSRIICTSSLERLHLKYWPVARQILALFDKDSALVELVLEKAEADPILWKVLELSRAIKVLRIFKFDLLDPGSSPLSPSSMPQLCVLEAPSQLAFTLVPGRPLHTVIIPASENSDVLGIQQLRLSTVPIRVLHISVESYFDVPFDELRQLEVLQLFYNHRMSLRFTTRSELIEHVSLI